MTVDFSNFFYKFIAKIACYLYRFVFTYICTRLIEVRLLFSFNKKSVGFATNNFFIILAGKNITLKLKYSAAGIFN